jgi:5-(carboxyamino)imidazole ribonucleotide synthase
MPDARAVLDEAGGHWHDYGKEPRAGRKVGHATLRSDDAAALAASLQCVGAALGRQDQVLPVIHALQD